MYQLIRKHRRFAIDKNIYFSFICLNLKAMKFDFAYNKFFDVCSRLSLQFYDFAWILLIRFEIYCEIFSGKL